MRALLPLAAVAIACAPGDRTSVPPADLVLRGGAVYTVDAARSWATAVAVRDGRIVYVGTDSVPPGLIGPSTSVEDLHGRMVLPGFQDGHVHLIQGGVELGECALFTLDRQEIADSIRACAAARPDAPWVRGSGWELPAFHQANPSKELLDSLVPDRPAVFDAFDGHSSWANTGLSRLRGLPARRPIRWTAGSSETHARGSRAAPCGKVRWRSSPPCCPSGRTPSCWRD